MDLRILEFCTIGEIYPRKSAFWGCTLRGNIRKIRGFVNGFRLGGGDALADLEFFAL